MYHFLVHDLKMIKYLFFSFFFLHIIVISMIDWLCFIINLLITTRFFSKLYFYTAKLDANRAKKYNDEIYIQRSFTLHNYFEINFEQITDLKLCNKSVFWTNTDLKEWINSSFFNIIRFKKIYPTKICKVCKSKGKRRETRYICQLCLVPLHIT